MIEMNDAQRKLAEDNLKLVHFTISRYFPLLLGDSEIVSAAYLGLCRASQQWQKSKGKFTTYAITSIRNTILGELKNRNKQLDCISLHTKLWEWDDGSDATVEDAMIDGEEMDITHLLTETFFQSLTDEEQIVYSLRDGGYKRNDILRITGFNRGKFNTLMRSIRRKYYKSIR